MSDRVFYVGSERGGRLTGYVPAKFLTFNGKPVVDPTPGGSQNAFIYADGSDKYKTRGEIANPSNYIIVPANYTGEQAGTFAAEIARRVAQGAVGKIQALRRMDESSVKTGRRTFSGILNGEFQRVRSFRRLLVVHPITSDPSRVRPTCQCSCRKSVEGWRT